MKTLPRLAVLAASLAIMAGVAWAQSANPPCPQIGFANGCDVIVTINPDLTISIKQTGQPDYDGIEDQLVGVINNSNQTLTTLTLHGTGIFGFDKDGASTPTAALTIPTIADDCANGGPSTYGCTQGFFAPSAAYAASTTLGDDLTGYEGPNNGFLFNPLDLDDGEVFWGPGGVAGGGGTSWFSLENDITTGGFTVAAVNGVTTTPEPASGALAALGLLLLAAGWAWRQRAAARA